MNYYLTVDGRQDGQGAFVEITTAGGLVFDGNITIESWLKWDGTLGYRSFLSKPASAARSGYTLAINDGKPTFALGVNSNPRVIETSTGLSPNAWTHVAATYDRTVSVIYVNGVEAARNSWGGASDIIHGDTPLYLGREFADACRDRSFGGGMSDVRIWARVLDAEMLKRFAPLADLSTHPAVSDLAGRWRLDEGSGTIVNDRSGHGLQGILRHGAAWTSAGPAQWRGNRGVFFAQQQGVLVISSAPSPQAGSSLTIERKLPARHMDASRQRFLRTDGMVLHEDSGLALDSDSAGNVSLEPKAPGKPSQYWYFDPNTGLFWSPGRPGFVLRARRNGTIQQNFASPGDLVVLASDTADSRYSLSGALDGEPYRRWISLPVSSARAITNAAVSGALTSNRSTYVDIPTWDDPKQVWYNSWGALICDADGYIASAGKGRRPPETELYIRAAHYPKDSEWRIEAAQRRITNETSGKLLAVGTRASCFSNDTSSPDDTLVDFGCSPAWWDTGGDFTDISVGTDGVVFAVTCDRRLVYFGGARRWLLAPGNPGDISTVSVGSSSAIYVQDRDGQVLLFSGGNPPAWQRLGIRLKYLAATATGAAWGIDSSEHIVRFNGTNWEEITGNWQASTGRLTRISAANNSIVWGSNAAGEVWRYDPSANAWARIPGPPVTISVGGDGAIFGLDANGRPYRYNGALSNTWHLLPGRFRQLTVGRRNMVWALGGSGEACQLISRKLDRTTVRSALALTETDNIDLPESAPLLCARLSNVAYSSEENVASELLKRGYDIIQHLVATSTDTQGFLAYNAATASMVLVFRGTESMTDANIDVWQRQKPLASELGPDTKVPEGFAIAYKSIERLLMDAVTNKIASIGGPSTLRSFYVTGHSLGGALADYGGLQIAQWMHRNYAFASPDVFKIITFGSPPVGNSNFRAYYRSYLALFTSVNYVTTNDPVPSGKWLGFDFAEWDYIQAADVVTLPSEDGFVTAHSIATYITLLEAAPDRLSSIIIKVTTGGDSVAPWYVFDGPGTDRPVSITIGAGDKGRNIQQNLGHEDDNLLVYADYASADYAFYADSTETFTLHNPGVLSRSDLKEWTIQIGGGDYHWSPDNWNFSGLQIIADGAVVYDKRFSRILGPDNRAAADKIS